jgi:hypothetical protein
MGCCATDEYRNCEWEAQVLTSLAASQRPPGVADDQVGGRALSRSLADFSLATLGADFSGVRLHVDGHAPAAAPTAGNSYGQGAGYVPNAGQARAGSGSTSPCNPGYWPMRAAQMLTHCDPTVTCFSADFRTGRSGS